MKHTTLLAFLGAMAFTGANAQVDSTKIFTSKHEIKLGAVKLLAGGIVEGTYEYIHSPYFTYGASILGNFDRNNTFEEDFSVTPFVRFYFTEPKKYGAKGFFVEGFAKYINGRTWNEHYEYYIDDDGVYNENWIEDRKSFSAGAVGLSLGWKWINHTGFVFEVLTGVGRNFGGGNTPDASFRGDLNLGYRF